MPTTSLSSRSAVMISIGVCAAHGMGRAAELKSVPHEVTHIRTFDMSLVDNLMQDTGMVTLDQVAEVLSSTAIATTNLSMTVQSGGAGVIQVLPGGTVYYEVVGILSDDANQGLALVGFDLQFDGGDLPHADFPTGEPTPGCDNPMINFTRPWGITNPDEPCPPQCGFGGTIINGNLVQVGGGQNTITGTVLLGVAAPGGCGPAVIATGSFTAPAEPGTYTLALRNLFANVIREGETGYPFWAVDAAGVGTINDLTVVVKGVARYRLDIRPALCPNLVNLRDTGILPIALPGTQDLDVHNVDRDSLAIVRTDGVGGSVIPETGGERLGSAIFDITSPAEQGACECDGLSFDGIDDLVLYSSVREVIDALVLRSVARGDQVSLTLRGRLFDGTQFEATDCVLVTWRGARGVADR